MADPVVFQPTVETLAAFNARIGSFCRDPATPVVNILPSLSRSSLVLSLAAPDDCPFPVTAVMQPVLFTLTEEQYAQLETTLIGLHAEALAWLAADRPADASPPVIAQLQLFDVLTEHRGTLPYVAYVLAIGLIGQLEYPDEETIAAGETGDGA